MCLNYLKKISQTWWSGVTCTIYNNLSWFLSVVFKILIGIVYFLYRCLNFCRIFTELAESTLESVLSSNEVVCCRQKCIPQHHSLEWKREKESNVQFLLQNVLDLKVVEVMIKCLQHNDYEVRFSHAFEIKTVA